ncbi:MAG: hypothetical protein HW421_3938 [Ignavibacteria bacterium]|nr:hypothetical protein [Ignavibacteria bacterium]
MNFEEKVNEELKAATKAGNRPRMETLRSLRASIIEFNKSGIGRAMEESDVLKILNSAVKKRKESIEMFEKGNRMDLVENERKDLEVLMEFLPKQLSDDEIIEIAKEVIQETGASAPQDLGKVMGQLMKRISGKADGNHARSIVQNLLGA